MAAKEIKLTPGTTWLPLAAVIGIMSVLSGILITVVWYAATQSSKLDYVVEAVMPVPQIQQDIAVIKAKQEQQSSVMAGLEKKISTLSGGVAETPVPLATPAPPPAPKTVRVYSSLPAGWAVDKFGHPYKIK